MACEAGRDGFWLARWLRERGIEAYVMHPSSIPVSREHRRAKSDRIDTELLKRSLLGWLRGEPKHCSMVAIPSLAEEDARCASREHERLVAERTRLVNGMKALLVRVGITDFPAKQKKAAQRLHELRTAEGEPLPANMMSELKRAMARPQLVQERSRRSRRSAGSGSSRRRTRQPIRRC